MVTIRVDMSMLLRGRDISFKSAMAKMLLAGKFKHFKKSDPYEVANALGKRFHCVFDEDSVEAGLKGAVE